MRTAERVVPAENLAIAGLVPLSAVDWPGRLVATVFCQGCPLRCPYCQNSSILDPTVPGAVPWGDVEDLLSRRRGLLDGVVFTGGEALRQEAVLDAMARVKAEGFMVGLHTAGVYPRRLEAALGHVDWVGLDIKALPGDYPEAVGAKPGARSNSSWRPARRPGMTRLRTPPLPETGARAPSPITPLLPETAMRKDPRKQQAHPADHACSTTKYARPSTPGRRPPSGSRSSSSSCATAA